MWLQRALFSQPISVTAAIISALYEAILNQCYFSFQIQEGTIYFAILVINYVFCSRSSNFTIYDILFCIESQNSQGWKGPRSSRSNPPCHGRDTSLKTGCPRIVIRSNFCFTGRREIWPFAQLFPPACKEGHSVPRFISEPL